MKKQLNLLFALLLISSLTTVRAQITYSYSGGTVAYTVPPATFSVSVDAQGACGGTNGYYASGGQGAHISGKIAVTPGEVLYVNVGGVGGNGGFFTAGSGGLTGSFVGGGNGASYGFEGSGGGGGASDIRANGTTIGYQILVAGAGGGSGYDCGYGDNGGNANIGFHAAAQSGTDCSSYSSLTCGGGAIPPATPGTAASSGGSAGGPLTGGDGVSAYSFTAGGGGGGGYYGGGGGYSGGGGGGISYFDPTSIVITDSGLNCTTSGDGYVTLYPCTLDAGSVTASPAICVLTSETMTPSIAGGTWSSSNPAVLNVNSTTGVVTGASLGTATITYTLSLYCGTVDTTFPMTVISVPTPIFGFDSLCLGDTTTLYDTTAGGAWSSSASAVGTISSTGLFTSISPGITTITYSGGSCATSRAITVNPLPTIAGPINLCKFGVGLFSASLPGTWSSSSTLVATIGTSSGVVTGTGPGATNIIFLTRYGCEASQILFVAQPPLSISGPTEVCQDNALIISELIGGGTWSSSTPTVATVVGSTPPDAVVTGVGGGVAIISYSTSPACAPATLIVTVDPLPAPITGPTEVCVGVPDVLSDATPGGLWSSSNPDVLVSPVGIVTSDSSGESSTITYTVPYTTVACAIATVVNVGIPPNGIMGPDSVCMGTSALMVDTTGGGSWTTTDLAVAGIIDTSGMITGNSAGTVTVSYLLPSGCYALKTFTVEPLVAGSVTITGVPTGIVCEGTPVTLTAVPTNGGTTPTYVWEIFSRGISDTSNVFVDTPIHGDVIDVFMMPHGICALHDTVGDTVAFNIYPINAVPLVTVNITVPAVVGYLGQEVTFYSTVVWGGSTPQYQWFVNGDSIMGATSSTFTTSVYTNDTVFCRVKGNAPCDTTMSDTPGYSNVVVVYADYLNLHSTSAASNNLTLVPNPNNGTFTLQGTMAADKGTYEVTDMLGRTISTGGITATHGAVSQRILLNDVAPGTYLLRVNTGSGTETYHFVISE
jgi:Glycine rich protein/Secretion system C-terminal sorting domain